MSWQHRIHSYVRRAFLSRHRPPKIRVCLGLGKEFSVISTRPETRKSRQKFGSILCMGETSTGEYGGRVEWVTSPAAHLVVPAPGAHGSIPTWSSQPREHTVPHWWLWYSSSRPLRPSLPPPRSRSDPSSATKTKVAKVN